MSSDEGHSPSTSDPNIPVFRLSNLFWFVIVSYFEIEISASDFLLSYWTKVQYTALALSARKVE